MKSAHSERARPGLCSCFAYADQVERDFKSFVKGIRDGRVKSDMSRSRLETALCGNREEHFK